MILIIKIREGMRRTTFEKFEDWRQYAAVMQKEAVTFMPSSSGGGNVVVA
jgi:hypothetical protein